MLCLHFLLGVAVFILCISAAFGKGTQTLAKLGVNTTSYLLCATYLKFLRQFVVTTEYANMRFVYSSC